MSQKPTESEDYYDTLDIPRTATSSEIKKAYRKQALQWHPDKNPDNKEEAESRFKLVAEAYEILSDKEKRRIYDKYGREGLTNNGGGGGGSSSYSSANHFEGFEPFHGFHFQDPMDLFEQFFGGTKFDDLFGFNHFARHRPHARNGRPHHSSRHQQQQFATNNIQANPFGFGFPGFGFASAFNGGALQNGFNSGFNDGFDGFFNHNAALGNGGMSSSFSSFGGGGGAGAGAGGMKMSSTSSSFINGKQVTTSRVFENGNETVIVKENGVVTSHKVNGNEMMERLEYNPESRAAASTSHRLTSGGGTSSKRSRRN